MSTILGVFKNKALSRFSETVSLLVITLWQEHCRKLPRMCQWRLILKIVTVFLFINVTSSLANAEVTHDFASWHGIMLQGKSSDHFGYYFEVQNRLNKTLSSRNTFIIRPALRYIISNEFSLWLGYGWMPLLDPFQGENRIWQQGLYRVSVDLWRISARLRIDERWLANISNVSFRGRVMLRARRFLQQPRDTSLVGWNEFFYNLNSSINGPVSGFDQNRAFFGINFYVGERVELESGYLNVLFNTPNLNINFMSHALAVYTIVHFPKSSTQALS
jgi:hypothetical protein